MKRNRITLFLLLLLPFHFFLFQIPLYANPLIIALKAGKPLTEIQGQITPENLKAVDTEKGDSPLMVAVRMGNKDAVEALLKAPEVKDFINKKNKYGNSPLLVAIKEKSDNPDISRLLIAHKDIDVNSENGFKSTPLLWAARKGQLEILDELVKKGANINHKNTNDSNALIWAAKDNHPRAREVIDFLLEKSHLDVNQKNKWESNALFWGLQNKNVGGVVSLLANGADIREKKKDKEYLELAQNVLNLKPSMGLETVDKQMSVVLEAAIQPPCQDLFANFDPKTQELKGFVEALNGILKKIADSSKSKEKRVHFIANDGDGNPLEWTDAEIKAGLVPRGSAVYTSGGDIGVPIIHAAPGSNEATLPLEEEKIKGPTFEAISDSVVNSIELALANGHKVMAIPLIGGNIFLKRILSMGLGKAIADLSKEEIDKGKEILAEIIIKNAMEMGKEKDILFCMNGYEQEDIDAFKKVMGKIPDVPEKKKIKLIEAINIPITDPAQNCNADVIVNAANTEVKFGGGVSGAIGAATKKEIEINKEAKGHLLLYAQKMHKEALLPESAVKDGKEGILLAQGIDWKSIGKEKKKEEKKKEEKKDKDAKVVPESVELFKKFNDPTKRMDIGGLAGFEEGDFVWAHRPKGVFIPEEIDAANTGDPRLEANALYFPGLYDAKGKLAKAMMFPIKNAGIQFFTRHEGEPRYLLGIDKHKVENLSDCGGGMDLDKPAKIASELKAFGKQYGIDPVKDLLGPVKGNIDLKREFLLRQALREGAEEMPHFVKNQLWQEYIAEGKEKDRKKFHDWLVGTKLRQWMTPQRLINAFSGYAMFYLEIPPEYLQSPEAKSALKNGTKTPDIKNNSGLADIDGESEKSSFSFLTRAEMLGHTSKDGVALSPVRAGEVDRFEKNLWAAGGL